MARFTPNLLEEILRRTDIVQLVGRRVKLARKGQAFWGCCPFHQEKLASFKVMNALKERYAGQMDFGKASGTVKTLLTPK